LGPGILYALYQQRESLEDLFITDLRTDRAHQDEVFGSLRDFINLRRLGLPLYFFANELWLPLYVEIYGVNYEDVELTLKQAFPQLWRSCFLKCNIPGFTQVVCAI
jgi:hypothetical protein